MAERIDWYKKQGIQVLLDMHQDMYGPKVSGNGAPPWATYDDGLPVTPHNPCVLTYLQPGVMRTFDHLWNDKNQIQQDYSNMWKHVAQRLARPYPRAIAGNSIDWKY
ncbi:cellulase family glycosylhydrolase, partial [Bacillus wiedmannii]|nr:cellulase family glycosylhydrolase [Bacillus wiedmannii]